MFYAEIILGGSAGQVAAVDENSFVVAGLLAQIINNGFLPGQTARLFFVSAAKFDIA